MYRSLTFATLLASSVLTAEAATIPASLKRHAPAAQEQVFSAAGGNGTVVGGTDRSQMKRRLVRRRTKNSKRGGDGGGGHCVPTSTTDTDSGSPISKTYSFTKTTSNNPPSSSSVWQHLETLDGSNFFDDDKWDWWHWDDPTHGDVTYVDKGVAMDEHLAYVNNQGNAVMQVETTPNINYPRKSVRLHSKRVWNGGMVILDVLHMPVGCGTWPAWWMNGPDWPTGGEIDIIEGVNDYTQNQVSLHTAPGCKMPHNLNDGMSGTVLDPPNGADAYNCGSADTGNMGCGVRDPTTTSYGKGLNDVKGGVSVLVWVKDGISAYWFTRDKIPQDITDGSPNPSNWGTPVAHYPSQSCDMKQFFYDNFNIFDTTFCGDWAGDGAGWHATGPGEEQSCAQKTGYNSCSDYVRASGDKLTEAYWEIKSINYYNATSLLW